MPITKDPRNFTHAVGGECLARQRDPETGELDDSWRDLGDVPTFELTVESEAQPFYDSDELVRSVVISTETQRTQTVAMTVHDISRENVGMFLGGSLESVAQTLGTVEAESLATGAALRGGRRYQLGVSGAQPLGVRQITDVVVRQNDGVNEQQSIAVTDATDGTFTLTFGGDTTSALDHDASAAAVQAALELLPSIGAGNVQCAGGALGTNPVTVTFIGDLAKTQVAELVADGGSLTGAGAAVAVTTDTPGEEDTTFVEDTDYQVDEALGMIKPIPGSDLVGKTSVVVDYSRPAKTISTVQSDPNVTWSGQLLFRAKNAAGEQRDVLLPNVRIRPSGTLALKSVDAQQAISLAVTVLPDDDGEIIIYMDRGA